MIYCPDKAGKGAVKNWQQRAKCLAAVGANRAGGCSGTGDVWGALDRSGCSSPCSNEWERTKGKLWAPKPQYQSSREEGNYSGASQAESTHSMVSSLWIPIGAATVSAVLWLLQLHGCDIRSLFLGSFPNLTPAQGLWSLGVVGEIVADGFHHLFFHLQVSWCWSHKLHFLLVFFHISTAFSQTRENTLNHPKSLSFPKLLQVRLKVKDCITKLLQLYFEGRYLWKASNQIYKRPLGQGYSQ